MVQTFCGCAEHRRIGGRMVVNLGSTTQGAEPVVTVRGGAKVQFVGKYTLWKFNLATVNGHL
jgi:hypothetical protein